MDGTHAFKRHSARFCYNQSSEAHLAKEMKPNYIDPEAAPHANPDKNEAEMDRERDLLFLFRQLEPISSFIYSISYKHPYFEYLKTFA